MFDWGGVGPALCQVDRPGPLHTQIHGRLQVVLGEGEGNTPRLSWLVVDTDLGRSLEPVAAGGRWSFSFVHINSFAQQDAAVAVARAEAVSSPAIDRMLANLTARLDAPPLGWGVHPLNNIQPKVFNVTFERPPDESVQPLSSIAQVDQMQAAGAVLRNNVFGNNYCRAFLMTSPDALVENNVWNGTNGPLQLAANSMNQRWMQGPTLLANITLRNNHLAHGAITIDGNVHSVDCTQQVDPPCPK